MNAFRRWSRKDGTAVTFSQAYNNVCTVRLYRPDQSQLIEKVYESWQQWEARETAEELAGLLDCQLEEQVA